MFCYTVVSGIRCVLQELAMWSDISSEHPVFLQTVARLTNKNLSADIVAELNEVRRQFVELQREAGMLLEEMPGMRMDAMAQQPGVQQLISPEDIVPPGAPDSSSLYEPIIFPPSLHQADGQMDQTQVMHAFSRRVLSLIDRFLRYDRRFLDLLRRVRQYGREDRVWQTLLTHFIQEQEYMLRLMRTLRSQIR